jgi:hypothetical protein
MPRTTPRLALPHLEFPSGIAPPKASANKFGSFRLKSTALKMVSC